MSTRLDVLKAWEDAQRSADDGGALILDAAAYAGLALVQAHGDAFEAMRLVPGDAIVFWGRVRSHLLGIVNEEVDRLRAAVTRSDASR